MKSSEKITSVEGDEIINEDGRNAEILFIYFFIKYCEKPKNSRMLKKEWVLKKRNRRNVTHSTNLPVIILKYNSDIYGNCFCGFFSNCVDKGNFPSILKLSNITSGFKKGC